MPVMNTDAVPALPSPFTGTLDDLMERCVGDKEHVAGIIELDAVGAERRRQATARAEQRLFRPYGRVSRRWGRSSRSGR